RVRLAGRVVTEVSRAGQGGVRGGDRSTASTGGPRARRGVPLGSDAAARVGGACGCGGTIGHFCERRPAARTRRPSGERKVTRLSSEPPVSAARPLSVRAKTGGFCSCSM